MTTSRTNLFTLLGFAALLAFAAWCAYKPAPTWKGPLQDPDVRALFLRCGQEDDPPGTGMPAWPDGKQRYYTRQQWTPGGELKVEAWQFLEPGHVLVSAERRVDGHRIVIEPRWEVPPGGPIAACYAKLGAEVSFRNLPRGDYAIEAR